MRKPRIAVCISRFEFGGQSKVIEEQTKRLSDRFRFVLVTEKLIKPCPPWMQCIEVKAWKHRYLPIYSKALVDKLKIFDLIHCHDSIPFMDVALRSKRPLIVTSHGFPPPQLWPTLKGKVHALLSKIVYPRYYRKASRVIAISKYIRDWLVRDMRVQSNKVVLLYNGINLEKFKPLPPNVWIKYHLGNPMILYVGYIGQIKRIHILIDAMKEITREYPQAVLALVGHADNNYKQKLIKRAKNLKIERNIRFIGFVPEHELPRLYNAADVLVVTSPWEGFGFPIVEAMACGTPVVARNAYAMREHIEESDAGTLYSSDHEITKAILAVLSKGKEHYKDATLNYARSRFDWQKNVKSLEKIYTEQLGEH